MSEVHEGTVGLLREITTALLPRSERASPNYSTLGYCDIQATSLSGYFAYSDHFYIQTTLIPRLPHMQAASTCRNFLPQSDVPPSDHFHVAISNAVHFNATFLLMQLPP